MYGSRRRHFMLSICNYKKVQFFFPCIASEIKLCNHCSYHKIKNLKALSLKLNYSFLFLKVLLGINSFYNYIIRILYVYLLPRSVELLCTTKYWGGHFNMVSFACDQSFFTKQSHI